MQGYVVYQLIYRQGAWKRRKRTRTQTADTDDGHGCNHVRPSTTSCNTNMAEASGFVSNVIVSAMEGGMDNPIQISSEDKDVDQR